jgi:hypothetical protein
MRTCRIGICVFLGALLLIAPMAQGQFSRLKDKVLNKAGMSDKKQGGTSDKGEKGTFGEVKATFAAGVKKSANVSRQRGGTPEAEIATVNVASGGPQVASIKVAHMDARQFEAVRGYGDCKKLSSFQILSASQVKVGVDLTGVKSSGACQLYFRSGGETVLNAAISFRGK